jgi:hypothetical protein
MTHELVGNMHVHTRYSDGHGRHEDVAHAALDAGLDFVVVTDHNVWVSGMDDYYYRGQDRVLMLTGEEVHDQARKPQKNHLLIYETRRELAQLARDPQTLIDQAVESGGICFLAHPTDPAAPAFNEDDLSWVDWEVRGFHGLELWNFMSEFKSLLKNRPRALFYGMNPRMIASGPFQNTLSRWDQLLSDGRQVSVIGGSDAHATPMSMGPIHRVIFPYEFLFRAVNTHVLIPEPLSGDVERDRERIFAAIRRGHSFVGYDLPASTSGFRKNSLWCDSSDPSPPTRFHSLDPQRSRAPSVGKHDDDCPYDHRSRTIQGRGASPLPGKNARLDLQQSHLRDRLIL